MSRTPLHHHKLQCWLSTRVRDLREKWHYRLQLYRWETQHHTHLLSAVTITLYVLCLGTVMLSQTFNSDGFNPMFTIGGFNQMFTTGGFVDLSQCFNCILVVTFYDSSCSVWQSFVSLLMNHMCSRSVSLLKWPFLILCQKLINVPCAHSKCCVHSMKGEDKWLAHTGCSYRCKRC